MNMEEDRGGGGGSGFGNILVYEIIILIVVFLLINTVMYNTTEYNAANSYTTKIDNTTYTVSLDFVGHPEVAWDMCISNLQVLTNQGWIEANATQRKEVVCWYADMPSNSPYVECLMGNVDIGGFCP